MMSQKPTGQGKLRALGTGGDTHTTGRDRRSACDGNPWKGIRSEGGGRSNFFVVLADTCEDHVLFGRANLLAERALARLPRTGRCTCG